MRQDLENKLHFAFAAALVLGAGAVFWAPALAATGGDWPAPLDDVFIHFDFARSTAELHPFEWIGGQGFSSGETSPIYPFVLAVGYLIGFRGLWLGAWAAIVAASSLVVLMRSLREVVRPAPWYVSWIGGGMLVSVGVLDWTWFSGMEIALFGAAVGRALVAVKRAREASPAFRARAQWISGAWGAALVATRPEAAVLVAAFAVAVARRAGARSAVLALFRASLPGTLVTASVLGANRALTGDAMSAGAILKLLSRNPYLSDVERAKELVVNLAHVYLKVLPALSFLPLFALVALAARRTRGLAAACLAGAGAWALLVSWNGAARYQNFRYYMPAVALVLVASALGLAAMARVRRARPLAILLALGAMALAIPQGAVEARHFARASRNVHDQQVETGRRLGARMPPGALVLVGDAGAIPYVSRRGAIDALGLGGFRGMPFARAATHGEAATVELIERLAPEDRPAFLALYPNWFGAITKTFGRQIDRVTITDNVICGGPTKGIYVADWSALDGDDRAPAGVIDALDVADVLSEDEHAYVSPAPNGGWTVLDVKEHRFDAGRIIPEGQIERFRIVRGHPGPTCIVLRVAGGASEVEAYVGGARVGFTRDPGTAESWATLRAIFADGLASGATATLRAVRGEYRDFHVWIVDCAPSRTDIAPRAQRRGE